MIVIVLAGGEGSRIWPLSKENYPKQFLQFTTERSLLQNTILRFMNHKHVRKILISTNDLYFDLVKEQIAQIDLGELCDIVTEPVKKNTAPAIAYCMRYLEEKGYGNEHDPILVLPSDHYIEPELAFHEHLEAVLEYSREHIVLFGIAATQPETGYGYIEKDLPYGPHTYTIKTFIEKPNAEVAQRYVSSGNHYWNCGMFLFTAAIFWQQLKLHAPSLNALAGKSIEKTRSAYADLPNISIDYALIEKTNKILLCPLSLTWSDIGSWDSLYQILPKDPAQNVCMGDIQSLDTQRSLIINKGKKRVSTIGIRDLLIINTEEALLIIQKGASQQVKQIQKGPPYDY